MLTEKERERENQTKICLHKSFAAYLYILYMLYKTDKEGPITCAAGCLNNMGTWKMCDGDDIQCHSPNPSEFATASSVMHQRLFKKAESERKCVDQNERFVPT